MVKSSKSRKINKKSGFLWGKAGVGSNGGCVKRRFYTEKRKKMKRRLRGGRGGREMVSLGDEYNMMVL